MKNVMLEQLVAYLPLILTYLPLIVTSATTVVCLILALSLRVQLRKVKARMQTFEEKLPQAAGIPEAKAAIEEPLIITNVTKAGLDTTVRSKVLKMHRQGQSSEQIAANLRLSRGEVDLLVKVHQMELRSLGEPASA
jgi:hypothetical protein